MLGKVMATCTSLLSLGFGVARAPLAVGVELQSGFVLDSREATPVGTTPFPPVGTIGNGTCFPTTYHGTDCDTHTSGYFLGVTSLAACKAKVSQCKMGNILSWGATDHSCSWYSQCDFEHLCVDCSKDTGPNCPISRGLSKCPHYFAFTSEVLRIPPTPTPPPPTPPTPKPAGGCFIDSTHGVSYIGGNIFGDHHQVNTTATADGCCKMCQQYSTATPHTTACAFFEWDSVPCYGHPGPCCRLKSLVAWSGRGQGPQTATTGSIHPLPAPPGPPPTCLDGTHCGGTNMWTAWKDVTLPTSTSGNPGSMPYPKSKDLVGWEFKSGCNPGYGSGSGTKEGPNKNRFKQASADTFYPTWAADGNLYTGYTDGSVVDDVTGKRVFAKSEGNPSDIDYLVNHGQAAIVGDDPFTLNMTKLSSFTGASAWPYGGRFPSGSLIYKGTWFYGTYYVPNYPKAPIVGGFLGPTVDFRHSVDMGETWVEPRMNATSPSDNLFGEEGCLMADLLKPYACKKRVKFGSPHWVDFGKELEHSPDGKAYIVAHGASSPSSTEMWMLGDQVYMARVNPTIADINDKSKWEFYTGGHGASAKWVTGDVSKAAPLIEWTNHTGSTTMTYFAGIKKYVVSICTASKYPVMDGGDFDTYFLESDSVTGPWSYVTYMKSFGPQVYFANYPTKFSAKQADTNAKTFDAFLMYSANYDPHSHTPNPPNSAYHMNLQQARFGLSDTFASKLEVDYSN